VSLQPIDIAVVAVFYAAVIGLALLKGRARKTSEDYFLAGRSLPWWIIGISIVSANISTEQLVGMAGQGAGHVGLAVSSWQLTGSVGIILVAFLFLPRFLRSGIYTLPEYLEYRYRPAARTIMALLTVAIYVLVTITAVLYSGGLAMEAVFGVPLAPAVWAIGLVATLYTAWGGLGSVVWAELLQGTVLLLGGLLTLAIGFHAVGGVESFFTHNADRLHMVLPADHPELPWTTLVGGMWIPIFYYCGLNQFIVQRTLAARSLREGQLGIIFAAALWLIVPFAIVFPGIMARQLYGDQMTSSDQAYPLLIRNLIPTGARGFIFAAVTGAVVSALASMLNSASTLFTIDIYKRLWRKDASERRLVAIGRAMTVLFVIIGCLIAPRLADPRFRGVFNFIQEFQGYISPGILAAFVVGFIVKRAPAAAGITALLGSAPVYGVLQLWWGNVAYLHRMAITFLVLVAAMLAITWRWPLAEPRALPVRQQIDDRLSLPIAGLGALVVLGVIAFYIVFW
jgi:solute:Na+ symporter, SSS family